MGSMPVPAWVDGKEFPSIKEAASSLGIIGKRGYPIFYQHIHKGTPYKGHELSLIAPAPKIETSEVKPENRVHREVSPCHYLHIISLPTFAPTIKKPEVKPVEFLHRPGVHEVPPLLHNPCTHRLGTYTGGWW